MARYNTEAAITRLKLLARHAFTDWIGQLDPERFLTLNSNCATTPSAFRLRIGKFLARTDREALGNRFRETPEDRTFLIGYLEQATYWHGHFFLKLPPPMFDWPDSRLIPILEGHWKAVIPSGSLDLQIASLDHVQRAVARYSTKSWRMHDFEDRMVISTEFHPSKSVT